ncbi:MAG: hypothetical protein HY866_05335 [Chloroflexi bacterium]|nr:hypothetical protein [Chloroflexota bacterium]
MSLSSRSAHSSGGAVPGTVKASPPPYVTRTTVDDSVFDAHPGDDGGAYYYILPKDKQAKGNYAPPAAAESRFVPPPHNIVPAQPWKNPGRASRIPPQYDLPNSDDMGSMDDVAGIDATSGSNFKITHENAEPVFLFALLRGAKGWWCEIFVSRLARRIFWAVLSGIALLIGGEINPLELLLRIIA